MNSTCTLRLIALACLGSVVATASFAQNAGDFYGGLSAGRTRFKLEPADTTTTQTGQTATDISRDDKDTAYKFFGGYQLSPGLGVEAGIFDLGKSDFTATLPAGTFSGRIKSQGFNLDLVGQMALTNNLSLLARVGAVNARSRGSFSSTGVVPVNDSSPSKRETTVKVGAGVQYALSPSMLLRTEFERYRINDSIGNHGHVNMLSVGLVLPFKSN
jgi:OmpA-OmpF porin, OOP family